MAAVKVYEALRRASSFLEEKGYEKEIADVLLMHHTGWKRTRMLTSLHDELDGGTVDAFEADVRQAASGVPVQHLTGEEVFFGRRFHVGPDVLIPRPETEELIVHVLESVRENLGEVEKPAVIDVGTGSGIIAVTLALELDAGRVMASDLSEAALAVARRNARRHNADVGFFHGDLLKPFIDAGIRVPVIVSNPPYIPAGDRAGMKENVKDHEPEMALFAGYDGLDAYRRLAAQIPHVLLKPGIVAFEIGHDQGEAVASLLRDALPEGTDIQIIRDINKNERIVLANVR